MLGLRIRSTLNKLSGLSLRFFSAESKYVNIRKSVYQPPTANLSTPVLKLTPETLNNSIHLWPFYKPYTLNLPVSPPVYQRPEISEPFQSISIVTPNVVNELFNEKPVPVIQAARLIVIRRRKMKKHKLKKLRKKMKFEWAKVRQRREFRKEKAFQLILTTQIKEAKSFNAKDYVTDKLAEWRRIPIPRYWKGRRLPQFIIKEKLGLK